MQAFLSVKYTQYYQIVQQHVFFHTYILVYVGKYLKPMYGIQITRCFIAYFKGLQNKSHFLRERERFYLFLGNILCNVLRWNFLEIWKYGIKLINKRLTNSTISEVMSMEFFLQMQNANLEGCRYDSAGIFEFMHLFLQFHIVICRSTNLKT